MQLSLQDAVHNVSSVNDYIKNTVVEVKHHYNTLLTTQVENLHAVSHFKNDTSIALQYAQDYGSISKESLKRTTKWGAKYFTHEKSYYPVPKSSL